MSGAAASPTICSISSGMLLSSLAIDGNEKRIRLKHQIGGDRSVSEKASQSVTEQESAYERARERERREDVMRQQFTTSPNLPV